MRQGAREVTFLLSLLFASASSQAASTLHPEVRAALDYAVVAHQCEPPSRRVESGALNTQGGAVREGLERSPGGFSGASVVYDTDALSIREHERELAQWRGCIEDYKRGLLDDFTRLKASARHGLTLEQANRIAGNLLAIQNVIMSDTASPDGP